MTINEVIEKYNSDVKAISSQLEGKTADAAAVRSVNAQLNALSTQFAKDITTATK